MTTIATDGKSMAGDGLSVDCGGLVCSTTIRKVRRLTDGRIMGVSGNPFDIDAIEEWLNEGGEFPNLQENDFKTFSILVLDLDGRVYSYALFGRRTEELLPCAIGNGTDVAVGAMEAGLTPLQAIELVCRRHINSGGEIIVEHLEEKSDGN